MPLTTEEYKRGQQWTINEQARLEGAETCEIIKNQPFENQPMGPGNNYNRGQYTYKIYRIADKVPGYLQ